MTDTINSRTLDEIKKALQCRVKGCSEKCDHRCDMCELYVPNYRLEDRYADAHAYIQQLEERNKKLENALRNLASSSSNARDAASKVIEDLKPRLAQIEKERDAAVAEIKRMECKTQELLETEIHDAILRELPSSYYLEFILQVDQICNYQFENEWRGICSENTKESSE